MTEQDTAPTPTPTPAPTATDLAATANATDPAATDPALRDRLVDSIRELLPQVLRREVTGVTADTALMDALGLSSTTGLELVLELEERLELEISVEELGRDDFGTVGSLADYVAGNLLTEN